MNMFENYSDNEREMLQSAHDAISQLRSWDFMKNYEPPEDKGFMWDSNECVIKIKNKVNEFMVEGTVHLFGMDYENNAKNGQKVLTYQLYSNTAQLLPSHLIKIFFTCNSILNETIKYHYSFIYYHLQ